MNLITHIVEPNQLFLVWQAPNGPRRTRRVVGELVRQNDSVDLNYLWDTQDYQEALQDGFDGYPAFKIKIREHHRGVLEILGRRLPPRTRSDFPAYLERLRLPNDVKISDFALLGYSEAHLPGDGFSVLNDFSEVVGPCEFLSEIAGFRYYEGMKLDNSDLVGQLAELRRESDNEFDPNAIAVYAFGAKLGYINRVQAPTICWWLEQNYEIEAAVERINGSTNRPLVYLFLQVRPPASTSERTAA